MFKGVMGAVYLSLIAFTTVFLILILLSLVMAGFKFLFVKEKKDKKKEIPEVLTSKKEVSFVSSSEEEDKEEEIAAVMAAIYGYLSSTGSTFRIRFIREIPPDSYLWKHSNKLLRRR